MPVQFLRRQLATGPALPAAQLVDHLAVDEGVKPGPQVRSAWVVRLELWQPFPGFRPDFLRDVRRVVGTQPALSRQTKDDPIIEGVELLPALCHQRAGSKVLKTCGQVSLDLRQ